MKRDISEKLILWKNSPSRKPLIIRGARQVGKTYTIKDFGKENFTSLIVLDFERDRSLHQVFSKDLQPVKMVQELEIISGKKIVPGKTLLFFDEIQACERAVLSLRYFYEEMPDLHIIAAGSLLEFAFNSISFPVGRISFEWMRPMTFREFLVASGKEILSENIPDIFTEQPVSQILHNALIEQLRLYFIVGGMPEAIFKYTQTNSFTDVKKVHNDIVDSYLESLVKYHSRINRQSLEQILKIIPSQVGRQVKYTYLDNERRIEVIKRNLQILEKALLVHLIHSSDASGLPLGASVSFKIFKPLFLDIGLMQNICGFDPRECINSHNLTNIYRGAIAEQFIGQELLAAGGSENIKLYYWSRAKKSSSAEVDYIIVRDGKLYPIEVKSGPSGRLKSMHLFLDEHPHSEKGIVLSSDIYEQQTFERLRFLPLYSRFAVPSFVNR